LRVLCSFCHRHINKRTVYGIPCGRLQRVRFHIPDENGILENRRKKVMACRECIDMIKNQGIKERYVVYGNN
jgi:hypothetical protein